MVSCSHKNKNQKNTKKGNSSKTRFTRVVVVLKYLLITILLTFLVMRHNNNCCLLGEILFCSGTKEKIMLEAEL